VDHANKKFSKGYKSTGAGGVLCARHSLVRKCGLGDLQKGERYTVYCARKSLLILFDSYANMDFIIFSTLEGTIFTGLTLSYDIMCQWSRNLAMRMLQLPSHMHLLPTSLEMVKKVIPKLHIHGHGKSCQTTYSLNFLKYSARTNGEEPERWWAHINPVSMSTKEMGPSSRHDTIDDHAAAWNWRKITTFGMQLLFSLSELIALQVLLCSVN
jgi:hypothetical protein